MADQEKSVWDVSRQAFDPDKAAEVAKACGIATKPTSLELKDDKGKVVKTVDFQKVLFAEPICIGDTPADRLARAVEFFEQLQPPVKDKDENVIRENNPLDIYGAHATYSLDLTMRTGIKSKEKSVLEGPDKAIGKAAAQLAAHMGITAEAALARIKVAWGVE